ncbi:putative F-box/FBD/LRR-repeat protein At4g13965 [Miscanthus floridulus]|uniref:putative F-box/FBD/LRR-repeat protein At4g13965 n=1 Tax=Miscanthus floridulus TaxID=154761 RepID=UPI003459727D
MSEVDDCTLFAGNDREETCIVKVAAAARSAAKRARLSSGDVDSAAAAGEDRLSALHDDVLVSILLHLSTRAAARTTVLSRHWRRIWALLPELRFGEATEPHRFTRIYLLSVWFHGPGDLGDAISSPRCPCLQRLGVDGARGLGGLSIHSESMLQLELKNVRALSQLTVVAPALKELTLEFCFAKSGPVANITTPLLANLVWNDVYDLSSVNLGKMEHLGLLGTYSCFVYEYNHFMRNQSCVSLLQRFEGIETLLLTLAYPLVSSHFSYLDRIMPLPSYLYHGSLSIQVLM